MSTKNEPKYPSHHADVHISLYLTDTTLKGRMKRVAGYDGRDFSNWFRHHVLSYAENLVKQEETRLKLPPYTADPDEAVPAPGRRMLVGKPLSQLPRSRARKKKG